MKNKGEKNYFFFLNLNQIWQEKGFYRHFDLERQLLM